MEKKQLEEYLSSGYKDYKSFRQNVILPVFGVERFRDGYGADILKNQPELQQLADTTGICRVLSVGEIKLNEIDSLQIFDMTVSDRIKIARNRSNLQRLIRRAMDVHTSAFMIFHYEDAHWDWRFTYCHKGSGGDEFTNSKRYTFLLGPGEWKSCHTAAEHFMAIYEKHGNIGINDIEEAFSVEALSKEFFKQYKFYYDQFVEYLSNPANGMRDSFIDTKFDPAGLTREQVRDREEKPIRDYVKKLLGRIVFLHFLQKKGWLGVPADKDWGDGDRDFMFHLYKNATTEQKANFLDEILEPLFNDAFDTNRSGSDKKDLYDTKVEGFRNVRIPYLNGGLFERDPLDENKSHFPSKYFGDLLITFSQYNFTIDENDPDDAEVGVDPEMLGRIFENLLEDNKDKGAFYTPKEIVRYMCRESLIAYLQTDFTDDSDKEKIRNFVFSPDIKVIGDLADKIDKKLREVKICDPAIGSGAFPMGLLRELFYCRRVIEQEAVENAAKIKREIIQNNIYGVDIEKGAVDIARLRFWLSLIVEEESPVTLPNLDFKIMQGNSLLEQYQNFDLSRLAIDSAAESYINGEVFDPLYDDPRRELRGKLEEYYSCDDHDKKRELHEEIKENVYEQLELSREEIKDIDATTEFFLWHTWFYDVFSRPSKEGFDIVIGNPPYVEAKKLKYIASTLKTIYKVYSGTADLSVYFNELGLKLLREGGIMSFITTNKFFNTGYGKKVREQIAKQNINIILNFEQVEVFEDILVSSVIFNISKQCRKEHHQFVYEKFYQLSSPDFKKQFVEHQLSFGTYSQDYLDENEWSFANRQQLSLKEKIEKGCLRLKDVKGIKVYRGVTTGYNQAFIITDSEREELLQEDKNNSRIIKNMLQGRNIRKWYYNESEENLLQTGFDINIERDYPMIFNHLLKYKDELIGRSDQGTKWYNLRACAYYPEFEKDEKIIWGLTADKWAFALDCQKHYLPSNAYILTSTELPIKYVLGLLNSRLLLYYFGFIGVMTAGGAYTLKAATIENLPIPPANDESQQKIVSLVEAILKIKAQNKEANVREKERMIDDIVYELYGLDYNDVEIIENI